MREPVEVSDQTEQQIRDRIVPFTVPLLAVRKDEEGEAVEWAASGTLVLVREWPCIFTARHVVENLLGYPLLGLGITSRVHRYAIPTETVRGAVIGNSAGADQSWGPDLAALLLPRHTKGEIESREKVFFNLVLHRADPWPDARGRSTALWALAGVPAENSKVGRGVSVAGGVVGVSSRANVHERDGLDYVDLSVQYSATSSPPESFEGMSGGGLWLLPTEPTARGTRAWNGECLYAGVAFYQTKRHGDSRTVRCHGPRDLYGRAYDVVRKELGT